MGDACLSAGVRFVFEGWGTLLPDDPDCLPDDTFRMIDEFAILPRNGFYRVGPERSGRLLDGREWR